MSTPRRRIVGYSLLAAGILAFVGILVALLSPEIQFIWAFELSALGMAVAFAAIGLGAEGSFRLLMAAAAVGWILIAVTSVIAGNPGIPGLVGEAIAMAGAVLGGVVAYRRRLFGGYADRVFSSAMGLTGLYLLVLLVGTLLIGTVPLVVQVTVAVIWALDLVTVATVILRRR